MDGLHRVTPFIVMLRVGPVPRLTVKKGRENRVELRPKTDAACTRVCCCWACAVSASCVFLYVRSLKRVANHASSSYFDTESHRGAWQASVVPWNAGSAVARAIRVNRGTVPCNTCAMVHGHGTCQRRVPYFKFDTCHPTCTLGASKSCPIPTRVEVCCLQNSRNNCYANERWIRQSMSVACAPCSTMSTPTKHSEILHVSMPVK